MVNAHEHDVLKLGQSKAVISDRCAAALIVAAAVQPHHHWTLRIVVYSFGPYVEIETIFARADPMRAEHAEKFRLFRPALAIRLQCNRSPFECIAYASPRLRRKRRQKTARSSGRGAILNAFEDVHAVDHFPAHISSTSADRQSHGGREVCCERRQN